MYGFGGLGRIVSHSSLKCNTMVCSGPPSPAPESWLVAARIPPEYAPDFLGKSSGGNGSFKRRNG
mgnify:CR=1 FL=1